MPHKKPAFESFLGEPKSTKDRSSVPVISFSRNNLSKYSSESVSQKKFINVLNYIHFSEGQLFLQANRKGSKDDFLIRVLPEPCQGDEVTCRFLEESIDEVKDLTLKNLIIDDGKSILCMPINILAASNKSITAKMKSKCSAFSDRQSKRFRSLMVNVKIQQGSIEAEGSIDDFSSSGFRIHIKDIPINAFNLAKNFTIELSKKGEIIFSGICWSVRTDTKVNSIVLTPYEDQRNVSKKRKLRNPRLNLVPTPKISFIHPVTGRTVTYEIFDITTAGFSVFEDTESSLLFPGLIIHDATIQFAGGFKLRCTTQIVYYLKHKKKIKRHGFAIIDMDMKTYSELFDILSSAHDIYANFTRRNRHGISLEILL